MIKRRELRVNADVRYLGMTVFIEIDQLRRTASCRILRPGKITLKRRKKLNGGIGFLAENGQFMSKSISSRLTYDVIS